jgi:hypothetical protein
MKINTSGVISLGTGAAYAVSQKQTLNTKSTTESELVGIDDVLPQALCTKYFMEGQGYGASTIVNQDNQGTIRLADNGKASSGRGTRHINDIRYFFITDRIARKEVAIQYCPTKQMVADYFTKPLQGVLFYKFRDQVMGVVPMSTIMGDHRSVLDKKSNETRIMKNPHVSWKLDETTRKRGAHKMTGPEPDVRTKNGHPLYANVVKSRPPTDRKRQEKRVKH